MKHELLNRLVAILGKSPLVSARSFVIAVSGGVDSMVLLDSLRRLGHVHQKELKVLHVHHGTGPFADVSQGLVTGYCHEHQIPIILGSFTHETGNFEAEARNFRYTFFRKNLEEGEIVFLGHHQNDQAETILHSLLRGTKTSSFIGMPVVELPFFRPFFYIDPVLIYDFALAARVPHVIDPTNYKRQYLRNCFRHEILPRLDQFHAGFRERLARFGRNHDKMIAQLTRFAANLLPENGNVLPRATLESAPDFLKPFLIQVWFEKKDFPLSGPIQEALINSLEEDELLMLNHQDKKIWLDSDGLEILEEPTSPQIVQLGAWVSWGPLRFRIQMNHQNSEVPHQVLPFLQTITLRLPTSLPKRIKEQMRLNRLPRRWRRMLPMMELSGKTIHWSELEKMAEEGKINLEQTRGPFFTSNKPSGNWE